MTDSPILGMAVALSKALLWLFTTPSGLLSLGLSFLTLVFVRFAKALKERSLLLKAAGRKMGFGGAFAALAEETFSIGALAAANLPSLLALAAVLSVSLALSGTVAKLDEYLGLQRKIKEYGIVLKNLERRYKVARIECVSRNGEKSELLIRYFDQDGKIMPDGDEKLEILGSDIYVDALTVNFAYTGIESGEKINLAIPYRVFSDKVAQSNGLALGIAKEGSIPFIYERSEDQVYGIDKKAYDSRIAEILALAKDAEKAREAGIVRSVYGNAVHRVMKKGDSFMVWVEQSGGLTIKDEKAF